MNPIRFILSLKNKGNKGFWATASRQPALVASLPKLLRIFAHSGDGQALGDPYGIEAALRRRKADLLAGWTRPYKRRGA